MKIQTPDTRRLRTACLAFFTAISLSP
jgi:hypothetical protein